jgi:hypothetical protein
MAMGTTVFRIRIELIFRRCWNLVTPSRSCRGRSSQGRPRISGPRTRWRRSAGTRNYGDGAFNCRSAAAISDVLNFLNCHRSSAHMIKQTREREIAPSRMRCYRPPAHNVKLTMEREIARYVWASIRTTTTCDDDCGRSPFAHWLSRRLSVSRLLAAGCRHGAF